MTEAEAPGAGPPPRESHEVLGDCLVRMQRYADLLASDGVLRGLIGPREVPRLWDRHVLNCLAAADLLEEGSDVLDLGSGAGLPGLVWAIARPDLRVELVEPLLRRVTWLDEVVDRLELTQVTVTRARAEELRGRRSVDAVTARAVAPLERLVEWSVPLLRPGGVLLALKGESAADEVDRAQPVLARLGTKDTAVLHSDPVWVSQPTTVVRVVAGAGSAPPARTSPAVGTPGARKRRR